MITVGQSVPAAQRAREDSTMTTPRRAGALTIATSIGLTLMSAIAAPSAQADPPTHTLVLTQQPPSLRPVDQGAPGVSVADIVAYEAPISG
jgi:hypothetical protein